MTPLSEGSSGYSVAENKKRGPMPAFKPNDVANPPGKTAATPGGNGVDPQFSEFSDIKQIHGNKGGQPAQPSVGYHRAD